MRIHRPLVACCALALAAAATAVAVAGNAVPPQLVTPGTPEEVFQPFRSVSGDGSRIYFHSAEKLDPADADNAFDVYERNVDSGTLRLLSDRVQAGADEEQAAVFAGVAHDGSRVIIVTSEPLVDADDDTKNDVYEVSANATTLLSDRVQDAVDENKDVSFIGTSRDATVTRFVTEEALVTADGDATHDLYVRHAGETKLASDRVDAGADQNVVASGGMASEDGTKVLFATAESILDGDEDANVDLYLRDLTTATTKLVSDRVKDAADAATNVDPISGISPDGSHVFFNTAEPLMAGDGDATLDVFDYRVSDGVTSFVSKRVQPGPDQEVHASIPTNGMWPSSTDGGLVLFSTTEPLVTGDTDAASDIYSRSEGVTKLISHDPTNDADGPLNVLLIAMSPDGSRVVFSTWESMSAQDTDSAQDVYVREGETTTLLSDRVKPGPDPESNISTALANREATRVFFTPDQQLVEEDSDGARDLYESAGGVVTLLSDRTKAGPDENQLIQSIAYSENGSRVFFGTYEQLVDADTDANRDIYWAGGTALPDPQPTVTPTVSPAPTAVPTATPTVTPPVTKPPTVTPPALKASEVLGLPSAKRCVSRRRFRIRLKRPSGTRISRVVISINGKRKKAVSKPTAVVDLRGLPKGRITVKIEVRTADGRSVKQTRRYRTCAPRRRG